MRKIPVILSFLLLASTTYAKEYGSYDPQRLLAVTDTSTGKQPSFNVTYLDQMLSDLYRHAKSYPAKFDTPQDRERAVRDVKVVSKMLDILVAAQDTTTELLWRAGLLNSIGHNLDIAGTAEKADAMFRKLLAITPADPRGNYLYGLFLAGVGKPKEALPYLEKADSLGVGDAVYPIGMVYLALGDKGKALESLRAYKRTNPADTTIDIIIEGISSGKIKINYDNGAKAK